MDKNELEAKLKKYSHVKSIDDLKKMGNDEMMNFYNDTEDAIAAGIIPKQRNSIKNKYGVTHGEIYNFLRSTGEYKKSGHYIIQGKPRAKSTPITSEEALYLQKLLQVTREKKDIQKCVHFNQEINERFCSFLLSHPELNLSEHIMMALIDYMDHYDFK